MPAKQIPDDLPAYSFATPADFEAFLEREHTTAPGFYLKLAKKKSGMPSITSAEAVEVALCFGWIDGWGKGIDEQWWFVRYTPRRPKSIWSLKNVGTISRLMDAGRMRPAGVAVVEAAKADGRWDRAYGGSSTTTVPEDLVTALATEPAAASFFDSLSRTDRYAALLRVQTASPNTRSRRIEALVRSLAQGKVSGNSLKSAVDTDAINEKPKPRPKARKVIGNSKAVPRKVEGSTSKINSPARPSRRPGLRQRP